MENFGLVRFKSGLRLPVVDSTEVFLTNNKNYPASWEHEGSFLIITFDVDNDSISVKARHNDIAEFIEDDDDDFEELGSTQQSKLWR